VPVAVQALSSNALEQRGIARTFDLPNAVPGLSINRAANVIVYFLRGVGNSSQTPGSDPSIASYIDGVYQPFPNSAILALNNVERVEVLKGPQGTLFGRNATGGLIQIVTKTPTADPTFDLKVGYDTFDTISASGYVSGGSGIVAADLAMAYSNQQEGWGRNLFTPDQAGTVLLNGAPIQVPALSRTEAGINRDFAIASKVVITPSDDLTIKLAASYSRNKGDQGLYRNYLPGSKALMVQAGMTTPYTRQGGFWDWNSNSNNRGINQQLQLSGDITYELGSVTLRSTTAYIDAEADTFAYSPSQPRVESPGAPQNSNAVNPTQAFSQELQLLSDTGGSFEWIVGGYYLHNRTGQDDLRFLRGNSLDGGITRHGILYTDSFAGFGQASYNLTPELRVTGGVRYTYDKLSTSQYYIGTTVTTVPAPPPANVPGALSNVVPTQKTHYDNLTYRLSVDYHFTPDVMLFASVNTGYKSGTFNVASLCTINVIGNCPTANIAPPVKPEELTAYEAGFKTELFNRMVRFNASAFYYDYRNLQLITLTGTPIVSLLQNAAKARIKGIDAELNVAPTRNLSFNGAIEILDAKYEDFPNAAAFAPRTEAPFGNAAIVLANAKGNWLSRAPKFSAAAGATWTIPLQEGSITLNGTYTYSSGFYWEVSNRVKQSSYGLLNLEATFSPDDHWSVKLWGRNVGNTKYYTFVDAAPYGERGAAGAPATYGVTLGYKLK
jgi:iron complex outermembrane receptor protein